MKSLWKNPVISNIAKQTKPKYSPTMYHHSLLFHTNIIYSSRLSFCSSIKDYKTKSESPELSVNGSNMSQRIVDLDDELPGKPDFMDDGFEDEQELQVLGLHDTEIQSKQAPDSRIFNPEYDPEYDPSQEDQIEAGSKKSPAQHRIIKSSVKEDVVIEMEAISHMERLYSWLLLGISVYAGMMVVRFYFMRDELKKERDDMEKEEKIRNELIAQNLYDSNTPAEAS